MEACGLLSLYFMEKLCNHDLHALLLMANYVTSTFIGFASAYRTKQIAFRFIWSGFKCILNALGD